jgi:hypothetical protein
MPGVLRLKTFEQHGENVVTEYIVGIPSGEVIDVTPDEFTRLRKNRVVRYDQQKKMFRFLDDNYKVIRKILLHSPERVAYIEYIMNTLKIPVNKYKVNSDLSVDVTGNIDFSSQNLKKIPIKFGVVNGDFCISYNQLNNLVNSPSQISGYFDCSSNEIYTLVGGPRFVAGGYYCNDNNLENLEGFPIYCEVTFTAQRNKLNSLHGCPEKITCRHFDVSYNRIKNLKGGPKYANDFDVSHNQITTLVGGPVEVRNFDCTYNRLYGLLGMPAHNKIKYDAGNQIEEIDHDYI